MLGAFKGFHGRQQTWVDPKGLPTVKSSVSREGPKPIVVDKSTECHVTPDEEAAFMVECLNLEPDNTVLEPSCGTGQLIKAILNEGHDNGLVTGVESHAQLAELCRGLDVEIVRQDFLDFSGKLFDRIIMNPPFSRGKAAKHVAHARSLLLPEGELIALVPVTFKGGYTVKTLPAGTFSTTQARTKIISYVNED